MTNLNHYLEAFKKLSEEDQNNILNDLFQVKKKLEEQQESQVGAIFKNLIESSAWKRFVAKRKELASILVGQVENDLATAEQQVIRLQSALDQAQNELKKTQNKVRTIEKKYLGTSLHTLTDAHPKIKEAINSGEINVYIKQSDGGYMLGDEKFTKEKAHELMGKESLYAITEQCDYRDGKKRTATTIFARKNTKGVDGIQRAFELQDIKQKNYTDSKLLTEDGLKPLFKQYKNRPEYEYLFGQPDWLNLDSNAKQELQKLVMEINLPKTGFQNSVGGRRGFALDSFLWLPLCFNGKQVYLGSNDSDANFGYGDESAAHPVYTFAN